MATHTNEGPQPATEDQSKQKSEPPTKDYTPMLDGMASGKPRPLPKEPSVTHYRSRDGGAE